MPDAPLRPVIAQLRRQAGAAEGISCTDRQLLERFTSTRDETAFEALVYRHAPMVLGACRRLLSNPADAEDAFQATFLVLVRKAGGLSDPNRLGAWLHGVACRTAREARRQRARRASREKQVEQLPEPPAPAEGGRDDWLPLLDEEVNRLPEKYRVAVVLCELEGHSRGEAAQQLGLPEGTLSSRLARARDLLRRRLTRRGLTLAAGVALFPEMVSASPALVTTTVKAALASAAPPTAAALAEKVIQIMSSSRLKITMTLLLAALCLTGGAALAAHHVWTRTRHAVIPALVKKPAPRTSLSARIDAPAEIAATAAELTGKLVLTNDGDVPVRVCTLTPGNDGLGGAFGQHFRPDWWKSDRPPLATSAKHVVTLAPGKSVSLPFRIARVHYKDRDSFTITGFYAVENKGVADALKLWVGKAVAQPKTVKVRKSVDRQAVEALEKRGLALTSIGFDDSDPSRPVVDVNLDDHIGDADLALLRRLRHLRAVRLDRKITDAGLVHLRGMTQLRELHLNFASGITDRGMESVAGLTGLRVLDLGYTSVTDTGLRRLRGLTHLRRLRLYKTGIMDAGLPALAPMTDLAFLDIGATRISDAGLRSLKGLTKLETLYVGETAVSDNGLAALRQFPRLQVLNLQSTQVSDAGLAQLRRLEHLHTLYLGHDKITDAGVEQLGKLGQFRELDLSGTKITDKGLSQLRGLGKLQTLTLSGTAISDVGLAGLRGLSELRELSLNRTAVTDAGLVHLKGLKRLRVLWLVGTRVTKQGAAELCKDLPLVGIRLVSPYSGRWQ
jgi:RNA polymerase sigma factor (sigma-70 family)